MILLKAKHYADGTKLSAAGNIIKTFKHKLWLKCEHCGKVVIRAGYGAVKAKSCGCVPNGKHNLTSATWRHHLYTVWQGMRNRCLSKKNKYYPRYGGRGITICKEWADDAKAFFDWAKTRWKPGLMLDRKDNNGNYTPENCRFTTMLESNRNRGFCITKEQALVIHALLDLKVSDKQIAKLAGVTRHTVYNVKRGLCWRKEQCLT